MDDSYSAISTQGEERVKVEVSSPKKIMKNGYVTVISIIVMLLIWEIIGRQLNPILATYPSDIAKAFWKILLAGSLLLGFVQSVQSLIVGYLLAVAVGIPLGLLIGRYRLVEAAINIYVTAGYATPLVALMPLFMLWFGLGFTVKVAIIFTLTIFPIIINTTDGVKAVPITLIEVGTAFVATQSEIMRKIILPATTPYIMTGLRLGVGKAIIAMIIAEFFTAINGLGGIIINAGNSFQTAVMFVPVIILMILGVGLTALVGVLSKAVAPWQDSHIGKGE